MGVLLNFSELESLVNMKKHHMCYIWGIYHSLPHHSSLLKIYTHRKTSILCQKDVVYRVNLKDARFLKVCKLIFRNCFAQFLLENSASFLYVHPKFLVRPLLGWGEGGGAAD